MVKGKDIKARIFAFTAIAKAKLALKKISELPKPMVYQGTIGQGGTVQTLPANPEVGDTYIVITDGTYGSFTARVGDIFVYSESAWTLIPTGDIDTWRNVYVDGTEVMSVTDKDPLKLVAGTNITLTWDSTNKTITVATSGLATVATSGSYTDLSNTPSIPTKTSDLTNDSNFLSGKLLPAQTLTAGSRQVVFTDDSIVAGSWIDVATSSGVWYDNLVINGNNHTCTLTFPSQTTNVSVQIKVS